MQDERALAEALRRALEPAPREPAPERIAALQRQLRHQRRQRPLRRAAVAAAAALIALMGAALAVRNDGRNDQRSADAVAISNTRAAIDQVRFAIAAGNPAQIARVGKRAGVGAGSSRARREGRGRCRCERRARRGASRTCAAAGVEADRSNPCVDHDVLVDHDILVDHDVDDVVFDHDDIDADTDDGPRYLDNDALAPAGPRRGVARRVPPSPSVRAKRRKRSSSARR